MTSSEHLSIVVRAAGERTADDCCRVLAKQAPGVEVIRVQKTPFRETLREGLSRGAATGAPWLLSVDADVLPSPDAVVRASDWATHAAAHDAVISGMILDRLLNSARFGGVRLYRTSVIPMVLEIMPGEGETVRPESAAILRLVEQGWNHVLRAELVGLHDYEQYYRDLYRKAFLHMRKHGGRSSGLLQAWQAGAQQDPDYLAALAGAADALLWREDVDCDASHGAYRSSDALARLGLEEKGALDWNDEQFAVEVERLREAIDNGVAEPVTPDQQGALDRAQSEADNLRRIQRMGNALRQFAGMSPGLRQGILHQVRRALPDEALLGSFSPGELVGELRRRVSGGLFPRTKKRGRS